RRPIIGGLLGSSRVAELLLTGKRLGKYLRVERCGLALKDHADVGCNGAADVLDREAEKTADAVLLGAERRWDGSVNLEPRPIRQIELRGADTRKFRRFADVSAEIPQVPSREHCRGDEHDQRDPLDPKPRLVPTRRLAAVLRLLSHQGRDLAQ